MCRVLIECTDKHRALISCHAFFVFMQDPCRDPGCAHCCTSSNCSAGTRSSASSQPSEPQQQGEQQEQQQQVQLSLLRAVHAPNRAWLQSFFAELQPDRRQVGEQLAILHQHHACTWQSLQLGGYLLATNWPCPRSELMTDGGAVDPRLGSPCSGSTRLKTTRALCAGGPR